MTVVTYHGLEYEIPVDRDHPLFAAHDAMARADADAWTRAQREQDGRADRG